LGTLSRRPKKTISIKEKNTISITSICGYLFLFADTYFYLRTLISICGYLFLFADTYFDPWIRDPGWVKNQIIFPRA
jgi:hypothetical protein